MSAAGLSTLVIAAGEKSKTPFFILGALFAAWAVIVALIGIRRSEFPGSPLRARLVMGLSILLVLGATGTAVLTASTPAKKEEEKGRAAKGAPARPPAAGALALAADPSGQTRYDRKALSARAGKVTIAFGNPSPVLHDVTIARGGRTVGQTRQIQASKANLTADLQAGTYTFYCSVDSHRQLGMTGTLTVS